MRDRFLYLLLLLALVISTLHIAALEHAWYYHFPWFDLVPHFLGGLFIGASALWIAFFSNYPCVSLTWTRKNGAAITLSAIIFFGVGWEIFEVFAGIPIEKNYALDTTLDLCMDMLGAISAFGIFSKIADVKI